MDDDNLAYKETDASSFVSEVFGGKLPIEDAIEKLRTKLLDLSSHNRLLKYRHPKGRCIQIVDAPNLNQAFGQLIDGKLIRLLPVSDPLPIEFESNKKPDVRIHAERLGISVSPEFAPSPLGPHTGRRLPGLQVVQYPADTDRLVRKVANEAKTAIEETGSNMLFLIFGFLEFYDSDDSDKPFLAPILSLPATLVKGHIDPETRSYQWFVQHSGEDLAENATLREKLKQVSLHLPEMEEDEEPERLFQRIEQAVRNKRRWKVKRQMTIGLLSFGKLAVWADLDPKKHPGILTHPLTLTIFKGGEPNGDTPFFAEDYKVDERTDANVPMIYDSDSSQHSAIIDVLSGKNVVINGPPGTGKSQTITNIIAAAITKGKKVLFVSEKLAALEVVQHRLSQAGLGHFCLELHSHKTQKKKFIEDVNDRLQQTFRLPTGFKDKIETLKRLKNDLARHATLMSSRVGNSLGLTINEIFWACERRRAALGDLTIVAARLDFPQAPMWSLDHIRSHRMQVEALADLWIEVGRAGQPHPWEGFRPRPFVPGDDDAIGRIVEGAKTYFEQLTSQADEAADFLGASEQWPVVLILSAADRLKAVPNPPVDLLSGLLPAMFDVGDPNGRNGKQAIDSLSKRLNRARALRDAAHRTLREDHRMDQSAVAELRENVEAILLSAAIELPVEKLDRLGETVQGYLSEFKAAASTVAPRWTDISQKTRSELELKLADTTALDLGPLSISSAEAIILAVDGVIAKLRHSRDVVEGVTKRWSLPFDDRPAAIARLLSPAAIDGLFGEGPIGHDEIEAARKLAASPLVPASASLHAIAIMADRMLALQTSIKEAYDRCVEAAQRFGLHCVGPTSPEEELRALVAVSERAPLDLMRYRSPPLADRGAAEIIYMTKTAIQQEAAMRAELESIFHLDAVPPVADLKGALLTFRGGKGFFSFLNGEWRNATRIFAGMAKDRRKRPETELADSLSRLLVWIEHRESFESNQRLARVFGDLFEGVETEVLKAEKLHAWHIESQALFVGSTDLHRQVDLVTVDATLLETLAARSEAIKADIQTLEGCEVALKDILGISPHGFREARRSGWVETIVCMGKIREALTLTVSLLGRRGRSSLSPDRIVQLMQAKNELETKCDDIVALVNGMEELRSAGDRMFERRLSGADGGWLETITDVSDASAKANDLIRFLANYVHETATVAESVNFIEAKGALDRAIAAVARPAEQPSSWDGYVALGARIAGFIRKAVGILQPAMFPGKSLLEGFTAMTVAVEAEKILASILTDQTTQRLFGPALRGFDTDDDAIARSHRWGETVVAALPDGALRRLLLGPNANDVLVRSRMLFNGMATTYADAIAALGQLASFGEFDLALWNYGATTPSALLDKVELALISTEAIMPLAKWLAAETECTRDGLDKFVYILKQETAPPVALGAIFEFAAYQSIAKDICAKCPDIPRFDGKAHTRLRESFKIVDREFIAATGQECAWQIDFHKSVPTGARGTLVSDLTEMHLLRHEINRQRRHIPIRQLVKRAGRALQELKPCFMMGPLSVAQYLEPGAVKFDLVVMDEASQLRPEDAIGAIARGSQLVVVGDPKQLPPTSFFDSTADDDDDDDTAAVVQGMESILDIAQQIFTPMRSLRWHYRSQHESLIAFSNHHFYKNLVVFPSPHADNPGLGVKWRYVKDGRYEDRRNIPEAQRVADAVVWHMKNFPNESLGVATLNSTQRDLVEELLDRRFRDIDECRVFTDRWEEEGWPFFVKNLENVQGDERDCVFISTTFGKPRGAAKVRQNFGPISRLNGWRRLNVLFTRAKRRVELFTSMQPEDIVVDERTPEGTRAFRDYLDYAKRGILTSIEENEREPDSDFEVAVAKVLRSNGYEVRPQLGVAGYFVDIAVRNPDRPGEWLAAIECDGATYHSGLSVRDRDRIRQEILEALGWKDRIYRIWSTDWFYNPLPEIQKLLVFLQQRRTQSAHEQMTEAVPFPWEDDTDETVVGISRDEADADADADARVVEALLEDEVASTISDLFVEVGDRVTYCFADNPSAKLTVLIVDSESNPRHNIVNEQTPLAQALLGLAQGEEDNLNAPGQKARAIRVIKIDRQGSMIAKMMVTA